MPILADTSASVAVVTAYTRQKLCAATEGEIDEITDSLVQMVDYQELAIDQRALVSYSILVFVCKMILEKVGLQELFCEIEDKIEKVVLPSYMEASNVTTTPEKKGVQLCKEVHTDIDKALKNFMSSITTLNVENVASLVTNKIKPSRCGFGEAIAFNVPSLAQHIRAFGVNKVLTGASIRHFITSQKIGCAGKSTKF